MSDVTVLLEAIQSGDPEAPAQLLPLVYEDLRRLAAHRLSGERPGQTLDPTALVHEAYLRLVGGQPGQQWESSRHFFAAAAQAMRWILVDSARRKRSRKRGGALLRHSLDEVELLVPEPGEDVVALDEALEILARTDSTAAELVQLRYFGGLSLTDAAQVLGLTHRSAERIWAHTRVWLGERITSAPQSDASQ